MDVNRRSFFKTAGLSGLALAPQAAARPLSEQEKLARIASNTWPIRHLFKSRTGARRSARTEELKKKYGEITMLDFPQFTKDHFPGVTRMDLFSGLFGDVDNDSMYVTTPLMIGGRTREMREFDPSSESGKRWLGQLANKMAATGTKCQHISNNAPRDICELDVEKRKAGIAVAKKWLDGAKILGAKSMRVNSGGPRVLPNTTPGSDGYPEADELAKYLANCIESFKEMADYGGNVGVKVTLENHWGLTANPMNIRIIIEEVNNPFCEASPDFCNWEHAVSALSRFESARPLRPHQCPRQVLESLEGQQRRTPFGKDHDRGQLRRYVRAGIRRRPLGRRRRRQIPVQRSAGRPLMPPDAAENITTTAHIVA